MRRDLMVSQLAGKRKRVVEIDEDGWTKEERLRIVQTARQRDEAMMWTS
jgi:hypothetical protein